MQGMKFLPDGPLGHRWAGALLALAVVFCGEASGAEFWAGRRYSLPPEEIVSGNLYVAAGVASISGHVLGDLVVGGGNVFLRGTLHDDLTMAGGTMELLGQVMGDVRVVGGQLHIAGQVGGDLVAAGGQIRLLPGATVSGDVVAAGGQVTLEGAVNRSVKAAGGNVAIYDGVAEDVQARAGLLTIGEKARIGGRLTYWSGRSADIHPGAVIGGPVTFHPAPGLAGHPLRRWLLAFLFFATLAGFLMVLTAGVLGFFLFRRPSEALVRSTLDHFGIQLVRGFVLFVVIPVALFLAAATVVGIPVAVLAGLLHLAMTLIAGVYAGIVFGGLVFKLFSGGGGYEIRWKTLLVGIPLLFLLSWIPVLGALLYLTFFLAVLGSLYHCAWSATRPFAR